MIVSVQRSTLSSLTGESCSFSSVMYRRIMSIVAIRKAFVASIFDAYGTRSNHHAIQSVRGSMPFTYLWRFSHSVHRPNSCSKTKIDDSTTVFPTWFRLSFLRVAREEWDKWLAKNWSYLHSSIYIRDDLRCAEIASDSVFAFFVVVRNKRESFLPKHFSSWTSAKQIDTKWRKHVAQISRYGGRREFPNKQQMNIFNQIVHQWAIYWGERQRGVPHGLRQHFWVPLQSLSTSQKCPSHKFQ